MADLNNLISNDYFSDDQNKLSCATFNLHGWNQGIAALNGLCIDLKVDCIFIQEHWLSPLNISLASNFSCDYTFYGKSAMEKAVSLSVLRGRPYGGAGILLNNKKG